MRIHSLVVAFGALAFAAQPALSQDAKLLERGTYLMNSIVACGNCHAQRDKQGRPIAGLGLSVEAHFAEGAAGAARFSSGKGRHGDFDRI